MTTLAPEEHEIPDDVFATLPESGPRPAPAARAAPDPDDILATLPELPSVEGLVGRLADVQRALDAARAEAESLRAELAEKAAALRRVAAALEAM